MALEGKPSNEAAEPRYPDSVFPIGDIPAIPADELKAIMDLTVRAKMDGANEGTLKTLAEAYAHATRDHHESGE